MKILELFSGYGSASFALKRLGINYELVGYSDIDKFANQCFKMNHCPDDEHDKLRLGDVTGIDPYELVDFDLLTGGFPCQSFSTSGKGLGELDPRGTLFNDIIRIAEVKKPKYMLLENVKGLTNKKFKGTFDNVLSELDRIGYMVYWKVLNSRDFGVPQNRERVWFVCFREDVAPVFPSVFNFPEKKQLKIFLQDVLESGSVDRLTSYCIDANYFKGNNLKGYLEKSRRQIVFEEGLVLPNATNKGFVFGKVGDGVKLEHPKSLTNRGRVGRGVSPCISVAGSVAVILDNYVIRKLTPRECFRLMGFLNDEIKLDGLSDTQRYKLAGNGQDVNVVSLIFKEMFKGGFYWV